MNDDELREHLDSAVDLLARAAPIALQYFREPIEVENKGGDTYFDPVTRADREVEEFLRAELSRRFPGYAILGEEGGEQAGDPALAAAEEVSGKNSALAARAAGRFSKLRWVIDPIDGTRAYISGVPAWGILLGLQDGADCLLGVMQQPYTGETFFASRGQGAWLRRQGEARQMRSCANTRIKDAVLYSTHPEMFAEQSAAAAYRRVAGAVRLTRYGGDCYSYCLLAMGQIDLVIENGLQPYDIVPLIPIIEESGGRVTNLEGGTAERGGFVVAAGNAQLHEAAIELLNGNA